MAASKKISAENADEVLWRMLAFARAVNHILDTRAVEVAGEELSTSRIQLLRLLQVRGSQPPGWLETRHGWLAAVAGHSTVLVGEGVGRGLDGEQ